MQTFVLEDFSGSETLPAYAILSHTWDGDEVSHQDIADVEFARQKAGFQKIDYVCEQAKADGIGYAWIDTCCIDKTSSHVLSEAINSMYRWYMNAAVCYTYLSDVSEHCPRLSDEGSYHPRSLQWISELEESRWFTRGWTLQELIAPSHLHFFGKSWNYIGSLSELIECVSRITGIQTDVLDGTRPLSDLSIACRLSWASKRSTSRIEDQAYSLFGILDVNMPLLYGEGRKAFLRLQEEIIRQSTDQSIFAWDSPPGFIESRELLLAPSPACFLNGSRIRRRRRASGQSSFTISNKGLEITLPIIEQHLEEDPSHPYVTLGILNCKYEGSSNVLALVLKQHPFKLQEATRSVEVYVQGYERVLANGGRQYGRVLPIASREEKAAISMSLTITKDLQSQTYIQDFSTNRPNWFPIRFVGDAQKHILSVEAMYPEECWYETSQTMRLQDRQYPFGGIVIRIQKTSIDGSTRGRSEDAAYILVTFGINVLSSFNNLSPRKIYALCYIDPGCPIEPHLSWLARRQSPGVDAAHLRFNKDQRIVAQLWNGALTVSIENFGDTRTTRTSSIHSLSPPTSPSMTRRQPSFPITARRDSVIQDDGSERSDKSHGDPMPAIHRTRRCENCRYVKAKLDADRQREAEEQQRRLDEEDAAKRRAQTQKKLVKGAKTAATGLTGFGILADVAEFMI